ncbi:MAG: cryptochrome/photolyase family protein [Ferruginibacter sp.]|nr:cryptochrome/photolyase family protein [Ferruginibacter sp.]
MPNAVSLIFPHQLFEQNPALQEGREVYLVEEWLFFRQYNFHCQKLVLHRASMKFYEAWLQEKHFRVYYIETTSRENDCRELIAVLAANGIREIHITDPIDNWLTKRVAAACRKHSVSLHRYENPGFLNTLADVKDYFHNKTSYFQTNFYNWQRKKRQVLVEPDGSPVGGKWSFDADNRQKFPKKTSAPLLHIPEENKYISEAKTYVRENFPNNYGELDSRCLFVVTFSDARAWLDDFLKKRFEKFGVYEDAIVANEAVLHHSVLTPMLNIGLLQPAQVLERAMEAAGKYTVPLNSLEGFIRQIMGWREFVRIVYEREGSKQRTRNYWKFRRKIPASFRTGDTGIAPIDITIKKILQTGYCHHIERLMVLGNFMLLCEFDPDEVYRWFMEMFIDAYDWVMVPNVYGMTQFADGGLMTTKPYISGSNYLLKMSDYKKGPWQEIWDGLFWRFMDVHRDFFKQNPRLGMLVDVFDKLPKEKQLNHLTNAENFLQQLDTKQ